MNNGYSKINDILERDYNLDLNDCDDTFGYVVNLLTDLLEHANLDGGNFDAALKQAREIYTARCRRAQSAE